MTDPIDPAAEASRLDALRRLGILDSAPEITSDAIVTAAASIANVPMSAISLIDADRQWFKAAQGIGVPETRRDISFCAHAIQRDEMLIVEDAVSDPRFCLNPLVLGPPHIRFYAGFVLRLGHHALGALCVIDDIPRQLSTPQVRRLRDLANFASRWMAGSQPGTTWK